LDTLCVGQKEDRRFNDLIANNISFLKKEEEALIFYKWDKIYPLYYGLPCIYPAFTVSCYNDTCCQRSIAGPGLSFRPDKKNLTDKKQKK